MNTELSASIPVSVDRIDALLPQTQCTQCGYSGCRPYAEAIAAGLADINRCPPGGQAGIVRLAHLLNREAPPLDPSCGTEGPLRLAFIEEAHCIGCTLCIQACPVDAIVGATKLMHTVIADLCTGCELCVPPCPVDCIRMLPAGFDWNDTAANQARQRFESRKLRLLREKTENDARLQAKAVAKLAALDHEPQDAATQRKRAIIQAAIERARQRRNTT